MRHCLDCASDNPWVKLAFNADAMWFEAKVFINKMDLVQSCKLSLSQDSCPFQSSFISADAVKNEENEQLYKRQADLLLWAKALSRQSKQPSTLSEALSADESFSVFRASLRLSADGREIMNSFSSSIVYNCTKSWNDKTPIFIRHSVLKEPKSINILTL